LDTQSDPAAPSDSTPRRLGRSLTFPVIELLIGDCRVRNAVDCIASGKSVIVGFKAAWLQEEDSFAGQRRLRRAPVSGEDGGGDVLAHTNVLESRARAGYQQRALVG